MKIVQSFWSKPAFDGIESDKLLSRSGGGWLSPKHHYLSWILSSMQLRKFYSEVELITDYEGKEILIDYLKLPYTNVKIYEKEIEQYSKDLWAIGKLYAYLLQDKPFLHVDSDVYIWGKFDESIIDAPIVVQGIDSKDLWYYQQTLQAIQMAGFEIPSELTELVSSSDFKSISAGVFGGTDLGSIHQYSTKAIDFATKNEAKLPKIDFPKIGSGMFNLIYEQLFFWCFAQKNQLKIKPLFEDYESTESFELITNFRNVVEKKTTYIHLAGGKHKKNPAQCEVLERITKKYFPEYYQKVEDMIKIYQ